MNTSTTATDTTTVNNSTNSATATATVNTTEQRIETMTLSKEQKQQGQGQEANDDNGKPRLPPLYFYYNHQPSNVALTTSLATNTTTTTTTGTTTQSFPLPSELFAYCLEFCNWGDLAKLSTVQSSWKHLLIDAAVLSGSGNGINSNDNDNNTSSYHSSLWNLATAMLHGTDGLQSNPTRAMKLLIQLAQIPTSIGKSMAMTTTTTTMAISATEHNDEQEQEQQQPNEDWLTLIQSSVSSTSESTLPANSSSSSPSSSAETYRAPAMTEIAKCYFTGMVTKNEPDEEPAQTVQHDGGTPQTTSSATTLGLAWLQAAFELGGDYTAAYDLALLYEYGKIPTQYYPSATSTGTSTTEHIPVDIVAAAQWFQRAATAGHVEAMAELALCYELGCGVEQDDALALDWYTKAANLGNVTAKFSVGEAFEEARGVPQSDEEACLWYYRAALAGDEDSKKALRRLYDIARIVVPGLQIEQLPATTTNNDIDNETDEIDDEMDVDAVDTVVDVAVVSTTTAAPLVGAVVLRE